MTMLGYPLNVSMAASTKRNDLRREPVTDPKGPGMTWCIHSINFADILDLRRAIVSLKRDIRNTLRKV